MAISQFILDKRTHEAKEKAKRRRRNKAARASRRLNRKRNS